MKRGILFVDDDSNVLNGLQRMLRPKRHEWDMAFASSGTNALAVMQQRQIDIIVSDMLMPGMDGNQLLTYVRSLYPDTIRFILSGHADRELICQSIDSTHQFISKPCDAEMLINTIERAFALRAILTQHSLTKLVARIKTIPCLPDLYLQLVEELKSSDVSIQRVGKIVSKDMGMSVQILHLVNSAFFGLRQHITDPAQAASLLGVDILKSVVLMTSVFSQMGTMRVDGWSLDVLWLHSLRVAMCAQTIAKRTKAKKTTTDEMFMAGMLHDVGKLLLIAELPDQYKEVFRLIKQDAMDILEAERTVLAGTHEEVGAYLLGLWGFSDPMVEAAAYHHRPSACIGNHFSPLTAVHVADMVANRHAPSYPGGERARMDIPYLNRVGCMDSVAEWETICEEIITQGADTHGNDSVR